MKDIFQVSLLGSTKVVTTSLSDLISQAKAASERGYHGIESSSSQTTDKDKNAVGSKAKVNVTNLSQMLSFLRLLGQTLTTCSSPSRQWRMLTAAASVPLRQP